MMDSNEDLLSKLYYFFCQNYLDSLTRLNLNQNNDHWRNFRIDLKSCKGFFFGNMLKKWPVQDNEYFSLQFTWWKYLQSHVFCFFDSIITKDRTSSNKKIENAAKSWQTLNVFQLWISKSYRSRSTPIQNCYRLWKTLWHKTAKILKNIVNFILFQASSNS